ncbi:helix-turn-helix domain containing protein [Streptomyces caniscabiei]|uniref:TetR/AcrR family transcriptional regulator n=1 Tax=Streptomyces caniscabiei TaxID=2746961 RepID=UPI0029B9DCF8|nr:helix-turn-helix domain-containing protein [Streptomyces caniscabiei]MDX2776641.1 helix-turn-helix domain containing protein [Streptomyces caniscabiei]
MSEETARERRIKERRRIQTLHRILDTTRILFDEQGWYEVTVDDIATATDVDASIIDAYFPTKQALALAAYSRLLRPIVEDATQAITRPWPACNPAAFIGNLAKLLTERPALAAALLPVNHEHEKVDITTTTKVVIVGFDQLAELLGKLIESYWKGDRTSGCDLTEAAELALGGLLVWILRYPGRSHEDAARLALNQLL